MVFVEHMSQDQAAKAVANEVDHGGIDQSCKVGKFPGALQRTCLYAVITELPCIITLCCEAPVQQSHIHTIHPDAMD